MHEGRSLTSAKGHTGKYEAIEYAMNIVKADKKLWRITCNVQIHQSFKLVIYSSMYGPFTCL